MNFIKDGHICYVVKDSYEPTEYFLERGHFIVSQKPNSKEEFNIAVLYSRILINVRYHGAVYNSEAMIKLESMLKLSTGV
jgi:hypothetical protein